MTKAGEEYHRKRALGLCGRPGCNEPATEHSQCAKHYPQLLQAIRRSKKRSYEHRRRRGLCVRRRKGCLGKANAGGYGCDSCEAQHLEIQRRWRQTPTGAASAAETQRKWREARRAAGVCLRCDNERDVDSDLCPDHREERRARDSKRKGYEVRKVKDNTRAEDFLRRVADDEDTESKSGRYWNRGEGSKSYCQPHTHGVSLGAPPFFYAYCTTCQEKKAAGKVTGEEGPLKENWAKKARKAKPKVDWERLRRNQEARRKFMLSQVPRE